MAYEWYKPKMGKPYISIARYGITFSRGAMEKAGNPTHIMAGYDEKNNKIIINPCDENERYGMRLRTVKYTRLNSMGFIKFLISKGIKVESKAERYYFQWDEDMKAFYVDLSD